MNTTTNAAASPDDASPNSAALSGEHQRNRIPLYKVVEATKALEESAPEQAKSIRWLHSFYYDSGKSLADLGDAIGYDGGNVSKVFSGKYEGDLAAFCKAVDRLRKLTNERASIQRAPYIETSLYRDIEETCQAALTYQKLCFIYGESQVGKTAALKHYATKHNHGETVYVEMPAGGSLSHFLAALASKVRINNQQRGDVLQVNIMKCFGPNNLLIVDEASRALQARSYGGAGLKTIDFIRSLHDQTGCGVVLCGTNVFREQMADRALAKFLNQFNRRCLIRRQLPEVPSRADLNAFARHYGLDPAAGDAYQLQRSVVREHGLGVWLTVLMAAARGASNKKTTLTWAHVEKAHAFLRQMEQVNGGEE